MSFAAASVERCYDSVPSPYAARRGELNAAHTALGICRQVLALSHVRPCLLFLCLPYLVCVWATDGGNRRFWLRWDGLSRTPWSSCPSTRYRRASTASAASEEGTWSSPTSTRGVVCVCFASYPCVCLLCSYLSVSVLVFRFLCIPVSVPLVSVAVSVTVYVRVLETLGSDAAAAARRLAEWASNALYLVVMEGNLLDWAT